MFQAKKVAKTPNGNTYVVLQDGPASFHVSVSKGDVTAYDHVMNPPSMEALENTIFELEREYFSEVT